MKVLFLGRVMPSQNVHKSTSEKGSYARFHNSFFFYLMLKFSNTVCNITNFGICMFYARRAV